jgi:hypothetical protein
VKAGARSPTGEEIVNRTVTPTTEQTETFSALVAEFNLHGATARLRYFSIDEGLLQALIYQHNASAYVTEMAQYAADAQEHEISSESRPWGEQQAQVDWLESRFDDGDLYDFGD